MRINTNTAAMNTYSNLTSANASKSGSLAKLSSGLRINKAGDDAAGLSISEKMKNQISGMTQASRNAQDGISLIQTAEGALTETHSMLNRMRDLTVQAGNDTNTTDDKQAIQGEIDSLTAEITRVADDTQFNTKGLLNGDLKVDAANQQIIVDNYNSKVGAASGLGLDTATVDATGENLFDELKSISDDEVKNKITANYNANQNGVDLSFDEVVAKVGEKPALVYTQNTLTGDLDGVTAAVNKYNSTLEIDRSDLRDVSSLHPATLTTAISGAENIDGNAVTEDDLKADGVSEFSFQIGANSDEQISVKINNMNAEGLGINGLDVSSSSADTAANLDTLDKAISQVSDQRAKLGATQNRLDHTVSNLATTKENLSEANSRITDVDMAEEMMDFTKSNILSQASTAMLAQANQMPQGVLQLLG